MTPERCFLSSGPAEDKFRRIGRARPVKRRIGPTKLHVGRGILVAKGDSGMIRALEVRASKGIVSF